MWVYAREGFFSIVLDSDQRDPEFPIVIRARVRDDLIALQAAVSVPWGFPTEIPGRDYPYRVYVSRAELGQVMAHWAETLDYSNFKDAVKALQGYARASLYSRVWSVMYGAEEALAEIKAGRNPFEATKQLSFSTLPPAPRKRKRGKA